MIELYPVLGIQWSFNLEGAIAFELPQMADVLAFVFNHHRERGAGRFVGENNVANLKIDKFA